MKLIALPLLCSILTSTVKAQLPHPATMTKNTAITNRNLPGMVVKRPNLVVKIDRLSYNNTGNIYTINYTLHNDGTDMGESLIELKGSLLNPAGQFTHPGGSEYLHVKSLKQGESYRGQITASIPLYIWQKSFSYQLEADPDNKIQEANEKDNSAVSSIDGYLDLPDLHIASATFIYQDSILQNGNWKHRFKIRYELKNNSTVPASLDVNISGLFGPTPRPGCATLVSGVQPPSSVKIGPWGTITNEIGCTAERSILSNGATYTITVNYPKTIEEKDMTNNALTITIPPIPANN